MQSERTLILVKYVTTVRHTSAVSTCLLIGVAAQQLDTTASRTITKPDNVSGPTSNWEMTKATIMLTKGAGAMRADGSLKTAKLRMTAIPRSVRSASVG